MVFFPALSQLLPVMSDLEYLQDQHLLLSVKSCDGFESYGQSDRAAPLGLCMTII